MKKKILSVALSLFAGLGLFIVVAVAPAQALAASTDGVCPSGLFCAWQYNDRKGTRWTISMSQYGGGPCLQLTSQGPYTVGNGNNDWGSVTNVFGNGYEVKLYDSTNCTNAQNGQPPHLVVPNFTWINFNGGFAWWNNKISSFHVVTQ